MVRVDPDCTIKDVADEGIATLDIVSVTESRRGVRSTVVVWPIIAVKIFAPADGLGLADADEAEAWEALGASA